MDCVGEAIGLCEKSEKIGERDTEEFQDARSCHAT
jgi:hypothetical protein